MQSIRLPLKRKWFDLIKTGIKHEEYREINDYWCKRFLKDANCFCRNTFWVCRELNDFTALKDFAKDDIDELILTLGYPKRGDVDRTLILKNPVIRVGTGKPEWGAEEGKYYFVITWN